jgi:hypothetical protein
VDRCLNCQFYDRKREKSAEGRPLHYGQCRRTAPMLNPSSAKSYMIEGVWPTVRDDDWCGEWKTQQRRVDARLMQAQVVGGDDAAALQRMAAGATLAGLAGANGSGGGATVVAGPMAAASGSD